ncbi:MAG: ROK family protein [Syntrophobacteraceae bacterium]|jgi:glucokinase|nr:ROK family protein [Syntrophobacteraceae bacterium]
MESDLLIGGDIGGTHMRLALVTPDGEILHQSREATLVRAGAADVVGRLALQCREMMEEGRRAGGRARAVGLGVAGKIDRRAGAVLFSPNLPTMNGFPLAGELGRALVLPVFLENDADVFGVGESLLGAGRGIPHWIGVTLGTGVGGCLILGGKLWRGDDLGFCGELGHMVIDPGGPLCACGLRGCLEAHASSSALKQGVRDAVNGGRLRKGILHEACLTGELTSELICQEARLGDDLSRDLFHRLGWSLGLALAGLFSVLGLRHAVIGGGVCSGWDLFIGPLMESLTHHSSMLDPGQAVIRRGELGDEAALAGSARLAWARISGSHESTS